MSIGPEPEEHIVYRVYAWYIITYHIFRRHLGGVIVCVVLCPDAGIARFAPCSSDTAPMSPESEAHMSPAAVADTCAVVS